MPFCRILVGSLPSGAMKAFVRIFLRTLLVAVVCVPLLIVAFVFPRACSICFLPGRNDLLKRTENSVGYVRDLDYDAAMLELLRMFLTFLSDLSFVEYGDFDLVFASQSVFALFFRSIAARPSAAGPVCPEIPARQRLFVVTRRV